MCCRHVARCRRKRCSVSVEVRKDKGNVYGVIQLAKVNTKAYSPYVSATNSLVHEDGHVPSSFPSTTLRVNRNVWTILRSRLIE